MYIGELIKEYRNKHQLSQREFADKTNLTYGYINILEKVYNPKNGKPYSVTIEAAKEIANAMNMSINEMLDTLEYNQEFECFSDTKYGNNFHSVPIYGTIPAGTPMEAIEDIIDYEIMPIKNKNDEYFGLKINGNSMKPKYNDGDLVIFKKQNDCKSGDACAVLINGYDCTFKIVHKQEYGILLQPININEHEPKFYTNKEIEEFPVSIIGVAVKHIIKIQKRKD